eukprot:6199622-Amphidinium_carterae.1
MSISPSSAASRVTQSVEENELTSAVLELICALVLHAGGEELHSLSPDSPGLEERERCVHFSGIVECSIVCDAVESKLCFSDAEGTCGKVTDPLSCPFSTNSLGIGLLGLIQQFPTKKHNGPKPSTMLHSTVHERNTFLTNIQQYPRAQKGLA